MVLTLHGRHARAISESSKEPFLGRLCERSDLPEAARSKEILLLRKASDPLPVGFRAYLLGRDARPSEAYRDIYELSPALDHLAHGDVVRIDPRTGSVNVLYRRTANATSFLVTERCDNYCVMCSQPPKPQDDSWIVEELKEVIPLIDTATTEVGITGGEPALLGPALVDLVQTLGRYLPRTSVHVLSNGRRFSAWELARSLGRVRHPDLMIGIPLYSDLPEEHDYVVQARGAFTETIRGILNLKRARVRVEIRVVIHADTYARLPELARFLTRNLLFVDHVALMGLELMGFARSNLDALWIDPLDYQAQLIEATQVLRGAGMNVSIYNHQLCVLDPSLHALARKSISDWKNAYFEPCNGCTVKSACGGFFASASLRKSRGIRPFD
jgi:His-Xaa-Ser system radical SAM maturase HxsC